MRQVGVHRHVGHHPRPVDEPGLRRHHEQQPFGDQGHEDQPVAHGKVREMPAPEDSFREHGVHRLSGHVLDAQQQIADQDARRRQGERDRHVEHRALAGGDARLAHDLEAVGHRLDAGIGAAAHGVRAQQQERHASQAQGREPRGEAVAAAVAETSRDFAGVAENGPADEQGVGGEEDQEDG